MHCNQSCQHLPSRLRQLNVMHFARLNFFPVGLICSLYSDYPDMVFPVPAVAMSSGASLPESTKKTMKIVFSVLLSIEIVLSGLRFYVFDIWGGVIITLIAIFGAFVVKYDFDLQWTLMFGITLFFYGLIHLVMCIERLVITYPLFPDIHNPSQRIVVRDMLLILAPAVDWTIVGLCYYVFKKSTSAIYSGTDDERQPLRTNVINRQASTQSAGSSFTPFSGQGRKLG